MAKVVVSLPPLNLAGLADEFKGGDLSTINKMTVDIDVSGREEIMRNIATLSQDLVKEAFNESERMARWLFDASEKLVPYKSGNLHDSEFIHEDESNDFTGYTVGYDAIGVQYAWYVHEIPADHYTKEGTRHHFLSDPAEELKERFPDEMKSSLREAVAKSSAINRAPLGGPRLVKKAR